MPHRSPRTPDPDAEDGAQPVSSVPLPDTDESEPDGDSGRPSGEQNQQNIQHVPADGRLPPVDGGGPQRTGDDCRRQITSSYRDLAWQRAVGLSEWWTVAVWLCIGGVVMLVKPQTDSLVGVFVAMYASAVVVGETPGFLERVRILLYRGQMALRRRRQNVS
jgi:hypothetical protein